MASAKERSNSPDLTIEDDSETRNNGKRLILIDRERSPSAKKRKIEQSDCAFDSDLEILNEDAVDTMNNNRKLFEQIKRLDNKVLTWVCDCMW